MDLHVARRYTAVVIGKEFEDEIRSRDLIFLGLELTRAEYQALRRRLVQLRDPVLQRAPGIIANVREDTAQALIITGMEIQVEHARHKHGVAEFKLSGFGIAKHLLDDRFAAKVGRGLGKAALRHSRHL